MEKQTKIKSFLFYAICLVVITVNYPKRNINSIAIILLVLVSVYNAIINKSLVSFFTNKKALLFSSLYLIYIVGLIHSSNYDEGFKNLRLKLPLALFPLIFSNVKFIMSSKQKGILQKAFVFSTLIYCFYAVIAVFLDIEPNTLKYIETGIKSYYHSELTVKLDNHPTYLSFTIILSVLFLKNLYINNKMSSYLTILSYSFFTIFIVLLSSKIGVILFIILSIYFATSILSKNLRRILFPLLGVIIIGAFVFPNKLNKRFYEETDVLYNSYDLKDKTVPYNKKSQRLIAINIYFSQPAAQYIFGLGSGDTQEYLDKKYRYYLPTANRTAFKDLNYHNQYLQTASVIGVLGLLVLILILYYSIKTALRHNNKVHVLFLIIIMCFFAIESFFETHRGTVLFAFFNYMFIFLWGNIKPVNK